MIRHPMQFDGHPVKTTALLTDGLPVGKETKAAVKVKRGQTARTMKAQNRCKRWALFGSVCAFRVETLLT